MWSQETIFTHFTYTMNDHLICTNVDAKFFIKIMQSVITNVFKEEGVKVLEGNLECRFFK